jgi:tetratricopeptide (TPR) repeat protein
MLFFVVYKERDIQIMLLSKIMYYPARIPLVLLMAAVLLLMNGCAGVAPVEKEIIPTPAAELLSDAEQSLQGGDYSRAELQLERALRVAPRNGQAWHLMARIRYGQGDYGQTVQFCLKSITLAGHDRTLKRQNWMLLEKAYTMLGDSAKAEEARLKAISI